MLGRSGERAVAFSGDEPSALGLPYETTCNFTSFMTLAYPDPATLLKRLGGIR